MELEVAYLLGVPLVGDAVLLNWEWVVVGAWGLVGDGALALKYGAIGVMGGARMWCIVVVGGKGEIERLRKIPEDVVAACGQG